jgi:hypothetical protein
MKPQIKRQIFFHQRPMYFLQRITSRRNAIWLSRLLIAFIILLVLYSAMFQYLMYIEGQKHSFIAGLYWIISTMTTVGLGDITFHGDAGKLFSIFVMCTGILFLLILLPFTIYLLFQSSARIPRELPEGTRNHVVLTEYGPLTSALIDRLKRYNQAYAVLTSDLDEAIHPDCSGGISYCNRFRYHKYFPRIYGPPGIEKYSYNRNCKRRNCRPDIGTSGLYTCTGT